MADRQEFENNDFTGGITDEYVANKDNRLDAADNICLDTDYVPIQRPGSSFLPLSAVATGGKHTDQTQIKGLIENDSLLVASTKSRIFTYDKTDLVGPITFVKLNPGKQNRNSYEDIASFSENLGDLGTSLPSDNPPSAGAISSIRHQDIIYSTNTKGSFPQKVFKEDLFSTKKTEMAGIPEFPQIVIFDGNGNADTILNKDRNGSVNSKFALRLGSSSTLATFGKTSQYYYSDKPYSYTKAGGVETINKATGSWTYVHLLSFCFARGYTVNGRQYVKRGAPSLPFYVLSDLNFTNNGSPYNFLSGYIDLTHMKELLYKMNSPIDDTAVSGGLGELFVEMYLSESSGTVLYLTHESGLNVGEDSNDNHLLVLARSVASGDGGKKLSERATLYTTGGILPNDQPPPCKFIAQVGEYTYYINTFERSGNISPYYADPDDASPTYDTLTYKPTPYRAKQSAALDPDSVPEGNFIDFPDPIMGGGAAADRVILATTEEVYRIDGKYDDLGAGAVTANIISKETGCISHNSMISVKDRLYFCGSDGVYATDGISCVNISRHISKTYKSLALSVVTDSVGSTLKIDFEWAQENITATYDKYSDLIIWSFGSKCLTLDLKVSQIESGYGAFYGPWFVGFDQTDGVKNFSALGILNDNIVRGDNNGYVYRMSSGYLSDPNPLHPAAANTWGLVPIIYRLRTGKLTFGSLSAKKFVSKVTSVFRRRRVLETGLSDLDVQINAYNDGERVRQSLKPIHYSGAKDLLFDADPKAGGRSIAKTITDTLLSIQRRFSAPGLRCVTKAIEFTNGTHLVAKSDNYEQGLVAGSNVSLPNFPTYSWPKESQDLSQKNYLISFDNDDYAAKYLVTSATSATLTLSTAPVAGSHKWKLYSYSTKQFFGLFSMGVTYAPYLSKQDSYETSAQGGNSGDKGE